MSIQPYDSQILHLRAMMQTPKADLHQIMDTFLTITEKHPSIIKNSIPVKNLRQLEMTIFAQALKSRNLTLNPSPSAHHVTRLVSLGLLHGTLTLKDGPFCAVVFFSEIGTGLLSLNDFTSPETHFIRITAVQSPPPSDNANLN